MPEISVIIPTHNRQMLLKKTLASLVAQNFPPADYEIVIVDNCSTDETKVVSESFIRSHPKRQIRYFYERVPGLLSGRHRGYFEAKGHILIFVDDDIETSPDWMRAIQESFEDADLHLVGGRNLPRYECQPPGWLEGFWIQTAQGKYLDYLSLLDFGETAVEIDPCYVFGLNFAIRAKTLFDLGGFHPDYIPARLQKFQGDGETGLSLKARKMGIKAVYQPKALIYHSVPASRMTPGYFRKRAFYQGICNSFTKIRSQGGPDIPKTNPSIKFPLAWNRFVRKWKKYLSACYLKVFDPNHALRETVAESLKAGYEFHQKEVRNDHNLFKWVLKENYWDYQLPSYDFESSSEGF